MSHLAAASWGKAILTRNSHKPYHYDVRRRFASVGRALAPNVFLGGMASRSAAMFCGCDAMGDSGGRLIAADLLAGAAYDVKRIILTPLLVGMILAFVGGCPAPFDGRPGPLCDNGKMWSMAASPEGHIIAVVGRYGRSHDGRASLYDAGTGAELAAVFWPEGKFLAVAFHPKDNILVLADEEGRILRWDAGHPPVWTQAAIRVVNSVPLVSPANDMSFDVGGNLLALGCVDGVVRVLDFGSGEVRTRLEGHKGEVVKVAWQRQGDHYLVSGGLDGVVRVWGPAGSVQLFGLECGGGVVFDLAFSSLGNLLAASFGRSIGGSFESSVPMANPHDQVCLFDLAKGELAQSLYAGGVRATCVDFTDDGRMLATGYEGTAAKDQDAIALLSIDEGVAKASLQSESGIAPEHVHIEGSTLFATFSHYLEAWDIADREHPRIRWKRQWSWRDEVPHHLSRTTRFPSTLPGFK